MSGHCPRHLHFENYVKALFAVDMDLYLLNSLVVVLTSVLVILALSAPASYVLSRKKFKGSNLITMAFIAGIGIPVPLLFIPLFIIMTALQDQQYPVRPGQSCLSPCRCRLPSTC